MSTSQVSGNRAGRVVPPMTNVDMKLEVVAIPVSDVERAKAFYSRLGWRLDIDIRLGQFRGIQFTPPGSSCSIHIGANVTPATPGAAQNMFLIVPDLDAACADLRMRGIAVSEVFHYDANHTLVRGPAPNHTSYGSYASFEDPDGNRWLLQEVTQRLPGRTDPSVTTFASEKELASAMRRAEAAHGEHEKRLGSRDANWPEWYAAWIAAEQGGRRLPT